MTGMFAAIRKTLWPALCMQRAKESVSGMLRYKSNKLVITKECPGDFFVQKKYAELMKLMSSTWMPKYWLTYVCRIKKSPCGTFSHRYMTYRHRRVL